MKLFIYILFSIIICVFAYFTIIFADDIYGIDTKIDRVLEELKTTQQSIQTIHDEKYPKLTSSEALYGEKSNFMLSPDKTYISFVQDVFEKYGYDWDRYWAVVIYNKITGEEKEILVDSVKMSSYTWLDTETIRVFHNAGTGVRVYTDVYILHNSPLITIEHEPLAIWSIDEEYVQKAKNSYDARRLYTDRDALL